MAKNEIELAKDDELLRKIRTALVEACLFQLEEVKNKRAKNPEVAINSAIAIYKTKKIAHVKGVKSGGNKMFDIQKFAEETA